MGGDQVRGRSTEIIMSVSSVGVNVGAAEEEDLGVVAALLSPLFMSIGFIIWDQVWNNSNNNNKNNDSSPPNSVGSAYSLNLYKCNLASIIFLIVSVSVGFFTTNTTTTTSEEEEESIPAVGAMEEDADVIYSSIGYLILSGFIGIIVGDLLWLEALKRLGAFQVLVIDTIKPFVAVLLAYVILNETIQYAAYGGIILTIVGIFVVSIEQQQMHQQQQPQIQEEDGTTTPIILPPNDDQTNNNREEEGVDETTLIRTTLSNRIENEETATSQQRETKRETSMQTDDTTETISSETMLVVENKPPSSSMMSTTVDQKQQQPASSMDDDDEELGTPQIPAGAEKGSATVPPPTTTPLTVATPWFRRNGYIMAIANVILDTYGSLLTKQHGGLFKTWTINLIRFGSSGILMIVISCIMIVYNEYYYSNKTETMTQSTQSQENQQHHQRWYLLPKKSMKSYLQVSCGVLFVTFLTPALTNWSLFRIALGLVLTLTSITPLYAMVLEWMVYGKKKQPTLRATFGAILAVCGVVVLSLFNETQ